MSKILYTMIRVGDLDRSIAFYKRLGMRETGRRDVPDGKYTLVFMGFEDDSSSGVELTYNYGVTSYEHGTAFGNILFGVPDIYGLCDEVRAAGVKIKREPGPVKFGNSIIAFIEDPDGYRVELMQHPNPAH